MIITPRLLLVPSLSGLAWLSMDKLLKKRRSTSAFLTLLALICTLCNPVSIAAQAPCGDLTLDDCATVVVPLDYQLIFNGCEGGVEDGANLGTGFTMVQPHSEDRLPEDEFGSSAPFQSFPAVPGYEPSRLAVSNGVLTITASRGIAYLDPPASSFNNNQINTLGVGLQNPGQSFVIRTQINALSTGGSSAQAGLWYGLDEDNFVKLVAVNDNQIEIRVEESGLSTQTNADRLQISENTAGQDILFELEVDIVNNTVEGFYTIGNGNRSSTGTLNIPPSFVSGITLADGTTSGVSFAGIFATYRNGSVYDADFESFSVSPIGDELSVSATPITGSVAENSTGTVSVDVFASNGAPTVSFTAEDCAGNVPTWLSLSGTPLDGTATHNTSASDVTFDIDATGLAQGTYSAKVTTAATNYASAVFEVEVTVTAPVSLFSADINFQDAGTTPPVGYLADFGEAYGPRTGTNQGSGLTYGWIDITNGNPVSLVGQGRNRGTPASVLLQTIIHMDHPSDPPQGYWEIAVPNGTYQVTATVGDGDAGSDPETHRINAEGITIVNNFPSGNGSSGFDTGSGTCTVSDGKLTLDWSGGGVNTKLAHVEIVQTSSTGGGGGQLSIQSVIPSPGASNVDCFTTSVNVNGFNFVPGAGSLDNATLVAGAPGNPGTVNLYDDNGNLIAGSVNGTAGGDNISFTPNNNLTPNTTYTFEVTSDVEDISGNSMQPWSSSFTTGNCSGGPDPTLADFSVNKTVIDAGDDYTSLTMGPDGKLYGLTDGGLIKRWDIVRTGDPADVNSDFGTLTNEETINTIQTNEGNRLAIGMAFDPSSTTSNLILWVSHTTPGFSGIADWGGKVARLSGPSLGTYQVYVENLPRSARDHVTNGIDFGPDGALYVLQGSNSAMGAPDNAWNNRPERLLSAACLRIDPSLITNPPLDVQTEAGGSYDPYAPNAPVKLFATGTRNPYDLVWHSNGNLYIPTNGSASGGNSPASVAGTLRPDGTTYSGQSVPAVNGHPTQPDLLFRVPAPNNGSWAYRYYGHPNPTRGEYVLNGGNPTSGSDPLEVSGYPVGTNPDANYAGIAFNFLNSKSPNGVIEYQSNAFGGALQGALIVCRYSGGDDLYALVPGGSGDIINDGTLGGSGVVSNPLDVVEDPQTGVLYVSEYTNTRIRALIPDQPATGGIAQLSVNPTTEIVQDQVVSAGPATVTITVSNPGSDILTLNTPTLGGTDAGEYSLDLSSFSTSVAAGSNTTFDLEFDPGSAGPKAATLTITGNAASGVTLDLKGLGKQGTGGSSEPSLQWIVDAYQLGIDVGDDDDATNILHSQSSQYTAPLLGPDEVAIQSFEKAGPGSVSLELLAVYGPTGTNPIVNVGYYLTGDANSTTQVLSVDNSPTSNGQSLQPPFSGSLTFDPGTDAFGFYSEWPFFGGRQLFSEDALNTFSGAIPHHVRVYPIPGETNAYLIATEEHVSGFDFQDVIFIARNVQPATVTPNFAGEIRLENMFKIPGTQTGFPSDSFLVFSRINNVSYHQNRESQTLRIHNDDATEDLQVSALTLSNPAEWDFPNGEDQNLPLTIPAGGSVDIDIDFVKSSGGKGIYTRSLTIASSDSDEPSKVITLSGAYMQQPEGGSEITTQEVFNAFGFTTTMLSDGVLQPRPNSDFPDAAEIDDINAGLEGDWIFSTDGWFERADPSEPIVAFQLAAYHGPGGAPTSTAGGGSNISFNHDGDWHQSLLPKKSNNNDVAHDIENTSGQFRLQTAGYSTQGRNFNTTTPDLGYRVYKVRDVNGNIIPNTFLGVQDYVNNGCGAGSANCDWNDNVVYWVNIKPVANASLGDVQNLAATAGQPVSYDISQFADNGYAGNGLVYTAQLVGGGSLPSWLTLNPQTGELSGTPPFNVTDPIDIEVTITDDNQNSYSDPFTMNVSGTTNLAFDGNEVITDATACGNVDGSIQVGTTGAVGTVTYTLTPGGVSNTTGLFSGLTPGSYTIEAEDDNDPGVFISATFDVGPTGCGNCSPISPLACGLIEVDLTNCFELTWDAGEGGIASTGFTMVDAPSQPLATNPLPDDPQIPGLVSANINVTGGQLQITSSNGIQFESNSGSTENNSQQNALGVGFDASASTFTVTTTLVNPDLTNATSLGNNAQQAGLWFGLDEDNYVKLVVGKTGNDEARVEMLRENTDPNNPTLVVRDNTDSGNGAIVNASNQIVNLYLTLDPVAGTAAGSYSLNGGTTIVDLPNTLTVPANFFTGELLPDGVNGPMSFAGVFTTHRRAAQNDAITFNFEDFAIRPDGNNCQAPTNQAPVANNDSETTPAGVVALVNILTNDSDSDGTLDPATVDLDPNTPGTEEASLTIAGEGVYTYSVAAQQLTFTPEAGFAGTSTTSYTVKDDQGEVSNVATVTITVTPVISCTVDAGPAQTLDCNNPSVFLSGNTSTGTYLWTTTDGNIVAGANTASPEVDAPGTYTLSVPGAGGITPFAQINFQDQASAAPAGYEADFGEAYGSKGSLTYGWVDPNNGFVGLDLSSIGGGNGRNRRDVAYSALSVAEQLEATMMHMQYNDVNNGNGTNGNPVEGAWEIQVPNGDYEVIVALGDYNPVGADPEDFYLNVEGVAAVTNFVPSGSAGAATNFTTATVTVTVTDGRLTLDAIGGTNTKITHVAISSVTSACAATDQVVVDEKSLLDAGLIVGTCNSNTAGDPSDDTFDFTLDPSGTSLTGTYTVSDANGVLGTGTYGTPETFTADADGVDLALTIADDASGCTLPVTVINPGPCAELCNPLSTLDCADLDVDVSNGFCLDFAGSGGGLSGTGFTMVVDPSAPLSPADDPTLPVGAPTNPSVDGYEPSLLNIAGGQLTIAATKGIMFSELGLSTETNSSVNHLGVAFDANLAQPYDIETEMVDLPAVGTDNSFHQGGLWFGLDEANHVKLVAIRDGNAGYRVQLAYEENDLSGNNNNLVEENSPVVLNTGDDVILRMTVDPTANTVAGFYSLDGGANFTQVGAGPITVGAALFQGITLPDASGPLSFAGVHATLRRGTTPLDFTFEGFCINEQSQAVLADVNCTLDLQNRTDMSTPVLVNIYQAGTNTVVNTITTTADANGDFAITGITPGTYDIAVKPTYFLQVMENVTLSAGSNSISFGMCMGGDADDNNQIDLSDYSILSTAFYTQTADPGYAPGADFDGNGQIDLSDYSVLSTNFYQAGETP